MNLENNKNNKLISLVFSFRNEEENLEALVKRTHDSLKKIDAWEYEMIFVNEGFHQVLCLLSQRC